MQMFPDLDDSQSDQYHSSSYSEVQHILLHQQSYCQPQLSNMQTENLIPIFKYNRLLSKNTIIRSGVCPNDYDNHNEIPKKRIKKQKGGPHQCEYCIKAFKSGSALGGHKSRVHPSQSTDYKLKITTANKRAPERAKTKEIQAFINLDLSLGWS